MSGESDAGARRLKIMGHRGARGCAGEYFGGLCLGD